MVRTRSGILDSKIEKRVAPGTRMIPFNTAILVSWILDGYEGLRVYNYKRRHVIEPIVENDFDDGCLAD